MRILHLIFRLSMLLGTSLTFGGQSVGGMKIDYQPAFLENVAKAQSWHSKMGPEMQAMLRQVQIFEAPGIAGMSEVRLIKFHYKSPIRGSIDEAASESVANIVRLPGIKKPTHSIVSITVSGNEARRVTFESGRNEGIIGAEFLVVQDKTSQSFYQLQMIFAKKTGGNPLTSLDLKDERTFAQRTLDSVQIETP